MADNQRRENYFLIPCLAPCLFIRHQTTTKVPYTEQSCIMHKPNLASSRKRCDQATIRESITKVSHFLSSRINATYTTLVSFKIKSMHSFDCKNWSSILQLYPHFFSDVKSLLLRMIYFSLMQWYFGSSTISFKICATTSMQHLFLKKVNKKHNNQK